MIKKVYISNSKKAIFVCPSCSKIKKINVSRYSQSGNRTKVEATCKCGCTWTSMLEKRKYYRMNVNVPCSCRHIGEIGISESYAMRVISLSSGGLRLKPDKDISLQPSRYVIGGPVFVDFHLGNNHKAHVKKAVIVKHIGENHIGAEFDSSDKGDPTISAYMFNQRHHQVVM